VIRDKFKVLGEEKITLTLILSPQGRGYHLPDTWILRYPFGFAHFVVTQWNQDSGSE
jgi:hypothetical protein